jgi:hypothetical protein
VVQAIARHADVKVTLKVYAHANLDAMREALGRLDGRLLRTTLLSPLLSLGESRTTEKVYRLVRVEPPVGIEPTTSRLQGECSGQLSYRGAGLSIAADPLTGRNATVRRPWPVPQSGAELGRFNKKSYGDGA